MTGYLVVVKHSITRMYHGAVYINHPTPSGCDRYLLSVYTKSGFATEYSAAEFINKHMPKYDPIDLSKCDQVSDEDVNDLIKEIPLHSHITLLTNDKEDPIIEIKEFDNINSDVLDIDISYVQLKLLIYMNVLEYLGSSGNDPELHYRYDYYEFTGFTGH